MIRGNEYEIRPLGFDVLRGEWRLDGLNESFTIERKSVVERMSKSASINTTEKAELLKDITPQRDTQFCRSNNVRSLLSIHIFLNDDLDGGNIEFHFPRVDKEKQGGFGKDMTIEQETECAGGLENGYKTIHIKPKVGKAVIYSPHLLYSLQPPKKGSTMYKLKTDVVVKRENENCIFVSSDIERDDYIKCMDYFRKAQSLEAHGKRKDAGELLEKALSIRYSYLTRVAGQGQMNDINIERQENIKNFLSDFVWEQIFDSLSGKDIENLVKAIPHLRATQTAWELHRFRRDEDLSENIPPYIPTYQYHSGIVSEFKFRDVSFFNENTEACIRVAAMYALYLLGRTNRNKFYTVQFNPDTHQVSGLALKTLLTEVFHNRPLHGAVYGINQLDENKKKFDTDFNASVDRAYMAMRHNAQFIGVPLSEKMKVRIRWPQITEEEITEIFEDLERGAESGAHVQDHLEHNDEVPLDCKPFITRSIKNSLIRQENAAEERVDEFLLFYDNRLCRIGGFPVILKDLMRYRKWHYNFTLTGLEVESEWVNTCLMWHNEVVYRANALICNGLPVVINCCNTFTAKMLYQKELVDVCRQRPGVSAAFIASIDSPLLIPNDTMCFDQIAFEKRGFPIGGNGYELIEDAVYEKCYNNLVFDFTSHTLNVRFHNNSYKARRFPGRLARRSDEGLKKREHDCVFYNSQYSGLCYENRYDFHYVVDITDINKVERDMHEKKELPLIDYTFWASCQCIVPEFEISEYLNLLEYSSLDHLHAFGTQHGEIVWKYGLHMEDFQQFDF